MKKNASNGVGKVGFSGGLGGFGGILSFFGSFSAICTNMNALAVEEKFTLPHSFQRVAGMICIYTKGPFKAGLILRFPTGIFRKNIDFSHRK